MDKIKVLVVEDNDENWIAAKSSLRKHAECTRAGTVTEGLTIFGEKEFDLVLLDLQLPDRPGLDFVSEIRKGARASKIPVYAVSASVLETDSKEAEEAGCDGFISKPYTRQQLLEILSEHLPS